MAVRLKEGKSMLLTRDKNQGDYEIKSYQPGKIKVNDTEYSQSLLLSAHLLKVWEPKTFDELNSNDLDSLLQYQPDLVLLGTGEQLIFPEMRQLRVFYEQRVGIEVMNTLLACHTFNVLMSEGRNVLAALIIR